MLKTILYNANIITMCKEDEIDEKKIRYHEALCFENGIIKKVGTNEEVLKLKDNNAKVVDMEGKTILPSFIDSHSHFSSVASSFLQVDLNECKSFEDIKNKIFFTIKNNPKYGKENLLEPSRIYLWSEYMYKDNKLKIVINIGSRLIYPIFPSLIILSGWDRSLISQNPTP